MDTSLMFMLILPLLTWTPSRRTDLMVIHCLGNQHLAVSWSLFGTATY